MKRISGIFILLLFYNCPAFFAQVKDSILRNADSINILPDSSALAKQNRKKIYSIPRKTTLMSVVLPGLGQAYNRKYWKIPIIYAGLGGFGYLFGVNNKEYNFYRKNLIAFYDNDSNTVNTTRYSGAQLQVQKQYYKKNRDFAVIGMALIYLFNIIDANVDAHLKTFDVSDDLSIHIEPWQNVLRTATGIRTATGLSIKLNFK